jgi:hypothetical protein
MKDSNLFTKPKWYFFFHFFTVLVNFVLFFHWMNLINMSLQLVVINFLIFKLQFFFILSWQFYVVFLILRNFFFCFFQCFQVNINHFFCFSILLFFFPYWKGQLYFIINIHFNFLHIYLFTFLLIIDLRWFGGVLRSCWLLHLR